ncbi:hypothetical protein [Kitasatospora sp. NPDC015120]|uniref:hypothetical protein n=1 Tax=Kitasatospora sp. NPDC015120 TaxID=3364023 RepID=UPI0036F488DD
MNWSAGGGWSYGWDNECLIDGDGPQVFLDAPADADPATVARLLEHAMTNQDDPARRAGSERLYEAVLDIWQASS